MSGRIYILLLLPSRKTLRETPQWHTERRALLKGERDLRIRVEYVRFVTHEGSDKSAVQCGHYTHAVRPLVQQTRIVLFVTYALLNSSPLSPLLVHPPSPSSFLPLLLLLLLLLSVVPLPRWTRHSAVLISGFTKPTVLQ